MSKYYCTVIFDASSTVVVEADTPEEAAEIAEDETSGNQHLCHQCSNTLETGDSIGVHVHNEECTEQLLDTTYRPPQQRKPLTGDATTFVQRFTDAVAILCGSEPPSDFVTQWLDNVDVDGVHRLQEWVLNQDATPAWAQGIGVLDAAHLLASTPVEGEQHEDEAAHGIKDSQ